MQHSHNDEDPLGLDVTPDAASLVHVTVERLFRILKAEMSAVLEARGSSIVEWRVLLMLRIHGELAQKDLVHEVAMVQAQVSRALASMRKRGLIDARRSMLDRRVTLFRLTPAGATLYRAIAPTMAQRKRRLDKALSKTELEGFIDGARKLAAVAAPRAGAQRPVF